MYVAELRIENLRCFGEGDRGVVLRLNQGLTAFVGENDAGKTTLIDALRLALGTRDQEYFRVQESDFHWPNGAKERSKEIRIRCKFTGLTDSDKSAFAEYLTYLKSDAQTDAVLYINWTAKGRAGVRGTGTFVAVEVRSGELGSGPMLDPESRSLLRATYLRPLRDAERAMAAGRGSRLSQILQRTKEVTEHGAEFDEAADLKPDPDALSVLGVGDYANALLRNREGIKKARSRLNEDYLKVLSFSGDELRGHISVSASGNKNVRLRQLLEKLELELRGEHSEGPAKHGLGSNNLLFMACELLLLGAEAAEFPLLLVEEPEAHLHPQRQVRLMQFLQNQAALERADGQRIQIIATTHSPNLASAIRLDNLVMIQGGKAFPLNRTETQLDASDYRFLERFLDVTKANLFFARGVVIVEGDGENILLPALARLIGRDFGEHGISVVNVGHTGLRRFSRIFHRKEPDAEGVITVPVACIADLDVMPDCAPVIIGKVEEGDDWPDRAKRQWRAESDFTTEDLAARRNSIREKASGQSVETFVADKWTLEYDLAYSGLAEDVWIAAQLARNDTQILAGKKRKDTVETGAQGEFAGLVAQNLEKEELSSMVYALFTKGSAASKAISAQYLAERLERRAEHGELGVESLRDSLPTYIVAAIEHVSAPAQPEHLEAATEDPASD